MREALERLLRSASGPAGALPPVRALARELGCSKNTVVAALEELKVAGLVRGEARRGLYAARARPGPRRLALADVGARALPEVLASGLTQGGEARALNVGAVAPPPGFFHTEALGRFLAARRLSLQDAAIYPDPAGLPALRGALAAFVARHGGPELPPEALVVTAGATGGLQLLLAGLLRGGRRRVAVEAPTSFVWVEQLRAAGAEVVPVPRGSTSLDLAALAAACPLAALLVSPDHQDPTGGSLPLSQRRALAALAAREGFLLLELHTHLGLATPGTPLRALAPRHTATLVSLSRTLGPGWRLGACAPPPDGLEGLRAAATLGSLGQPVLGQRLLAQLLTSGEGAAHLAELRRRLDGLAADAEAQARPFRAVGAWLEPWGGGLFRRFQVAPRVALDRLAGLAREEGVNLHPQRLFEAAPRSTWLRVNLAQCGEGALGRTLGWLAAAAR